MMRLAPDGRREMIISTVLLGSMGAVTVWAALNFSAGFWGMVGLLAAIWIFSIAFFRDPDRMTPDQPDLMVSPADGRVTNICQLDHYDLLGGPAIRISIFLSIFNVHINRAACAGRVLKTVYQPGDFLDARHPESGLRNESNTIVIQPSQEIGGPVIIRQVAGRIARRIVCNTQVGDVLQCGQRIGMIKFGSRTDLVLPAQSGFQPAVRVNDRVQGGTTVLFRKTTVRDRQDRRENHDPEGSCTATLTSA